jgi:tRNA A37 threonylcarbamoyltransferase TsaD
MIAFAGAKRLEQREAKDVLRFSVRPRWDLAELLPPSAGTV